MPSPSAALLTAAELARYVDHTLLAPTATLDDVENLVAEAIELGVWSVCVSPSRLPLTVPDGVTRGVTRGVNGGVNGGVTALRVATVCGFPSGAVRAPVKAAEAALAVESGADEIDMVINLGAAVDGEWGKVAHGIERVRTAIDEATGHGADRVLLKVIVESAALDDEQLVRACLAAREAGADLVKTSTGFHPAGGATVHAVEIMARTVGGDLGVKASGGIRTWADAVAMVDAGATRLGLSGTRAVLAGAPR